jgi:hypothetical protein
MAQIINSSLRDEVIELLQDLDDNYRGTLNEWDRSSDNYYEMFTTDEENPFYDRISDLLSKLKNEL